MIYMKSTSGNDGSYKPDRQLRGRLQCRRRHRQRQQPVQTALPQLPQAVQLQGLTVIKRSAPSCSSSTSTAEDGSLSPPFITSYATVNVLDELSRVSGVGQVLLFGKLNYSMRVWFDTQRLTSLNLAPSTWCRRSRPRTSRRRSAASGRARSATTSNSR